ncbi:hypothetical protein HDA31_006235 [Micromonospora carbonacea subsp. aurantiaca]|nr:hypothetical protein [Micromonospora carbonacea]
MRTGSSTGCPSPGIASSVDALNYYCFTRADDGYTWTFLYNFTTRKYGWVRDILLTDNGSQAYCGF